MARDSETTRKPKAPTARKPDLLRGAVAGIAAGLVASFAMDLAQKALAGLQPDDSGGGEPATEKAADRVSEAVTGTPIAKDDKPAAGQVVHYSFGALLGLGYGIVAELYPQATSGAGTLFGLGTALAFDEAAVPAVGLGPAPWETPAGTHAYSLASHAVFGVSTELTRKLVREAL